MPTITREIYTDGELVSTEEVEVPSPPLAQQLEIIFIQAVRQYDGLLPPSTEGDLFILKAGITEMLKFDRVAAAKAKIEGVTLPEALEPIRAAMLEKFPNE